MIDRLQYISQERKELSHYRAIQEALDAGCSWIQLRIKDKPKNVIAEEAHKIKLLCDSYNAKLIINDHVEIAKEVEAYGLHLGLNDVPVTDARGIVGDRVIIGGTANTIDDVKQRVREGVDYIGLGPFRFTSTKDNLSPILGIEGYRNIIDAMRKYGINIPVIAIGGIMEEDIIDIMETGVYGIAVSGTIANSNDKKKTVETILNYLHQQIVS